MVATVVAACGDQRLQPTPGGLIRRQQAALKPPSHSAASNRQMAACCAATCSSGLASRQIAGEGMFVEQDFDEVDSAGEIGVDEQGIEFGLGFDAVMGDAE